MTILLAAALACGFQQAPSLDPYGNATCIDVPTGTVQRIEGSPADCPAGTTPRLTDQGQACVAKDGTRYFDTHDKCPIGTTRKMNERGNIGCWP